MIRLVGLDGDDTLWHSESHFVVTEEALVELLAPYANGDDLRRRMVETERRNLNLFGYGVKGFTLSMIETAIEVSGGRISTAEIRAILDHGKALLSHPVELLAGVAEAVTSLTASHRHRVVIITKGDLFHQESKVAASGLSEVVAGVEIVAEKDEETYRRILRRWDVAPHDFLMIGNSLRSDVLPVLAIGAHAAHAPYHLTWELEHAEPPAGAEGRYWPLTSIRELPELLDRLAAQG